MPLRPWKTLKKKTLLTHPPHLTLEAHTIQLPDGCIIDNWLWVITPDYINVALVTDEGLYVCFRQTKYAVEGISLAPVGGYIEPGEPPLVAAKRETLEETGYQADAWISLGQFAVNGNRGDGTAHLFLATNAKKVAQPNADDLEEQQMIFLTRTEVQQAVASGAFKVLAWQTVMALALLHDQPDANKDTSPARQ